MPTNDHARRQSPTAAAGAAAPSRPTSDYVPAKLDATVWANLEPLYQGLLERPVESAAELERWLLDRSELDAAASEGQANLYIRMTCHTDNAEASEAWTRYLDEVPPKLKPMSFALDKRVLELFERIGFENLDRERYEVLLRSTRRTVELFREENVPLETELAKLDQKYDQICGAMSVEFEGEERTIPQMGRFLQVEDRDRRERAWRATAERRLQDKDAIDDIFDRMIELRHQIATNAGFDNYRDYEHARKQRFDYTPADCERFHAAVEQHVVPFMRRLDARRQDNLGVDTLRPWDLQVDEKGRPPLNPFETGQELIERTRTVFDGLDPQLAGLFRSLGDNATEPGGGEMLDLDSRKGKAFGGYQYHRDRTNRAFIFMNAAGLHRDVETMVHEAGHAFHSLLCADDPLIDYRNYPIEFAEVASMSMELLTMPKWEAYYPKEADGSAADRARRSQLEGSVSILAWIATIDAFQHWLYTHPEHTRAARLGAWLDISRRFGHAVSWEGLEDAEKWTWQRQGHLFGSPFYYIEYGIAQLGALGVWLRSLERGVNAALTDYKEALALGGSRPLPELFETAGVPFDFGPEIVGRLVNAVEGELAKLPE